jgi:peptidoglycan/xylan/chitin deacetylase (PgdA/CDA1 family)
VNPDQTDMDNDGIGDACDPTSCLDSDGDTVCDAADNCPNVANAAQTDVNQNGIGDACDPTIPRCDDGVQNGGESDVDCGGATSCARCAVGRACAANSDCAAGRCESSVCVTPPACNGGDGDGDGVCDDWDNCTGCYNPTQADVDGDGYGECWRCDGCIGPGIDADSDRVCDGVDNCVGVWNNSQEDRDGDGVGDVCDNCDDDVNPDQADSDGDGIGDACEPPIEPPPATARPCTVGDADLDGICDDVDGCIACDVCAEPWGAMLTLSFDDTYDSDFDIVLPLLQARGMKGTFYTISNNIGWMTTINELEVMAREGHEIGSHTVSHPDLDTLTTEEIRYQLAHSQEVIEAITGQAAESFATPAGRYDDRVLAVTRELYTSHRSVSYGLNFRGADTNMLHAEGVGQANTPAQVQGWIDSAIAQNGWRILFFHRITAEPTTWTYLQSDFEQILDYVQQSGIRVVTTREGAARMRCPAP